MLVQCPMGQIPPHEHRGVVVSESREEQRISPEAYKAVHVSHPYTVVAERRGWSVQSLDGSYHTLSTTYTPHSCLMSASEFCRKKHFF